jgi:hypothetical protein
MSLVLVYFGTKLIVMLFNDALASMTWSKELEDNTWGILQKSLRISINFRKCGYLGGVGEKLLH